MAMRPRVFRPKLAQSRRGATLVLVAVLMTVLVMFAGFGIDFGRMYAYKAQLKVLADAAALSAVTDLKDGALESEAKARAIALRLQNRVNGNDTAIIAGTDVEPGNWDFAARTFVTSDWSAATAVRVRASYTADWTLARIFGVTNRLLAEQSVAALGAQRVSRCLKPFAIPYSSLLTRVGQSPTDMSYDLTDDDIDLLNSPGMEVEFKVSTGADALLPGNFGFVEFPPVSESNKNEYLASVIEPGCSASPVAVGDTIPGFTGNMNANVIREALRDLCPTVPASSDMVRTCSPAPSVEVPIFDWADGTGIGAEYRVRYIGAFTLTRVDYSGPTKQLYGYLTALSAGSPGGFTPFPGPVRTGALVQ